MRALGHFAAICPSRRRIRKNIDINSDLVLHTAKVIDMLARALHLDTWCLLQRKKVIRDDSRLRVPGETPRNKCRSSPVK